MNQDARQDNSYEEGDRLLSIERLPTDMGKRLGIGAEKLEFAYDLLGRLIKETTPQGALAYEYDPLSNLTTLTLPTGQHLNHLYYGSGHLHHLNLDGLVISDMERDDLYREVLFRTKGDCAVILAVERVKLLFEANKIVGIQSKDRMIKNSFLMIESIWLTEVSGCKIF